jgi:membrane protein implicated in regulation of membrane protease activity
MEWLEQWIGSSSPLETLYWLLGAGATGLLLLFSLLSALGVSIDWDIDFDTGHPGGELSWQTLLVVVAVGGWTGVLSMREFPSFPWISPFFALGAAIGSLFLTIWLLKMMRNLESSGTLQLENAIGKVGTVYLTIPAGGVGQVQLTLQGRLVTLDAISEDETLPTGTKVLIYNVRDAKLVVIRYEEKDAEDLNRTQEDPLFEKRQKEQE